jgi:hypothetical protein
MKQTVTKHGDIEVIENRYSNLTEILIRLPSGQNHALISHQSGTRKRWVYPTCTHWDRRYSDRTKRGAIDRAVRAAQRSLKEVSHG